MSLLVFATLWGQDLSYLGQFLLAEIAMRQKMNKVLLIQNKEVEPHSSCGPLHRSCHIYAEKEDQLPSTQSNSRPSRRTVVSPLADLFREPPPPLILPSGPGLAFFRCMRRSWLCFMLAMVSSSLGVERPTSAPRTCCENIADHSLTSSSFVRCALDQRQAPDLQGSCFPLQAIHAGACRRCRHSDL